MNAPRLRILMLCRLTLRLVKLGYATKQLLETIVGSWVFVLMFRRPLLSLLSDVFHEGEQFGQRDIFRLSTGSKQELLLLCTFAPFAYTNLRASPIDKVFCSDASLTGSGVCVASVSKSVTLELCRAAEQRGFYTRVDTSVLGSYMALQGQDIIAEREIPSSLNEGFLWDFCEVFRGTGHLSAAHRQEGLRVHPGFDISDGSRGDVLHSSTFSAIIGLICRRVVKAWHTAPVCTTFGTLRRPRLRSKLEPFGFDPDEPATSKGNQFAMRGGFILFLCLFYGLLVSIEQPRGSVMYRLDIFKRLLKKGFVSVQFPFCNWGTPFEKLSWWISNNEFFACLTDVCRCGHRGSHFRIRGVFDSARLRQFSALCRPSAARVFGRAPRKHEHVAKFSGGYPLPLCKKIAALNSKKLLEFEEPTPSTQRPFSTPARWVGQLGRSLRWQKLLQYEFKRPNHINVNENLSYRSLLKHAAKTYPHSRFCAMLDSRVTIGCNAKGRSSSKQLNFYLASAVPYIIGGDLYPFLIHLGTHDNASDDISRFLRLRGPSEELPRWFNELLKGNPRPFDLVRRADSLIWPLSGWARMLLLMTGGSCNP